MTLCYFIFDSFGTFAKVCLRLLDLIKYVAYCVVIVYDAILAKVKQVLNTLCESFATELEYLVCTKEANLVISVVTKYGVKCGVC